MTPKIGVNGVVQIGYEEPEERYAGNINDPNYIDFACSNTWREFYNETLYGKYPPPVTEKVIQVEPPKIELTRIGKHEFEQVQGHILHLENKLAEHLLKKRKSKGEY